MVESASWKDRYRKSLCCDDLIIESRDVYRCFRCEKVVEGLETVPEATSSDLEAYDAIEPVELGDPPKELSLPEKPENEPLLPGKPVQSHGLDRKEKLAANGWINEEGPEFPLCDGIDVKKGEINETNAGV